MTLTPSGRSVISHDSPMGAPGGSGTNGINGTSTLLTTKPVDAGVECSHGGQRIDSGIDDDLDGQLDADEEALEVEIELVDKDMIFERPVRHVVEWGYKLAADVCELMA